jgi:hypothetical protein
VSAKIGYDIAALRSILLLAFPVAQMPVGINLQMALLFLTRKMNMPTTSRREVLCAEGEGDAVSRRVPHVAVDSGDEG